MRKPLPLLACLSLLLTGCGPSIPSSSISEETPSDISETTPSEESTPVTLPVLTLKINAAVTEIEVGHSMTLTATVTGSAERPVWSIEEKNPTTMDAAISSGGVLSAGSIAGTINVKASIEGLSDVITITVKEVPVNVQITNTNKEVERGKTLQMTATSSNGQPISWSIIDKDPVTVEASIDPVNGLLTAGNVNGAVTVRAACGSSTDTMVIHIVDPTPHLIEKAKLGYRDPSTGVGYYLGEEVYRDGLEATSNYVKAVDVYAYSLGDRYYLMVGTANYLSIVDEVLTFSSEVFYWDYDEEAEAYYAEGLYLVAQPSGDIFSLASEDQLGSSVIPFFTNTEIERVYVPYLVIINDSTLFLEAFESQQLYTHFDLLEGPVSFASSDESVAKVSSTGLVEWVGPGQAVITASIGNYQDTCTVECEEAVPSLEWIYPGTDYIAEGQTIPMKAISSSDAPIIYSVDDESKASIDEEGNLTAIQSYLSVTVTATLQTDEPISISKTIKLTWASESYVDILLEDLSTMTIGEKVTVPYRTYNVTNFDIKGDSGGFRTWADFVVEPIRVGQYDISASGYDIDYPESIRIKIQNPVYDLELSGVKLAVHDKDNATAHYLLYYKWNDTPGYLDSVSDYIGSDYVNLYSDNGVYYLKNTNVNAGYLRLNGDGELDYLEDPYPFAYDLETGLLTLDDKAGNTHFLGMEVGKDLFGAYPLSKLNDSSILPAFLIDQAIVA